jgi:hypothetical protein
MSGSKELVIDGYNDDISDEQLAEIISRNPNLEVLELLYCENITSLPILPDTLKELHIRDCFGIRRLFNLPNSLLVLECQGISVTKLSLPPLLRILDCHNCDNLLDIDINTSRNLEVLVATDCDKLESITGDIPQTLNRIEIDETDKIDTRTAQRLLEYYRSKDDDFRGRHTWISEVFQPIADSADQIGNLGIQPTNLFEGGKRRKTRKHKRSKRIKTGKRKGSKRRRTKKIKRNQGKGMKRNKTI